MNIGKLGFGKIQPDYRQLRTRVNGTKARTAEVLNLKSEPQVWDGNNRAINVEIVPGFTHPLEDARNNMRALGVIASTETSDSVYGDYNTGLGMARTAGKAMQQSCEIPLKLDPTSQIYT